MVVFHHQLPWLRLDALMVGALYIVCDRLKFLPCPQLNLVWVLPRFSQIATHDVKWAWILAAIFAPISLVRLCFLHPPEYVRADSVPREGMGGWRRLSGGLHSSIPIRRGIQWVLSVSIARYRFLEQHSFAQATAVFLLSAPSW
jgi:hypothetical protein